MVCRGEEILKSTVVQDVVSHYGPGVSASTVGLAVNKAFGGTVRKRERKL